ncbi:DUF7620 family protein [Micromonospora chersina]|uniref:DUF7620 family protein n=1 Tax=Micromonospora chersina TaxID=47854 RepID=UPI0037241602
MIRRRRWKAPDPEPEELEQARSAVAEAVRRLNNAMSRQPEVDKAHRVQEKIRRENHMAPRIASALGAHGD